jgi:hypothetical protein
LVKAIYLPAATDAVVGVVDEGVAIVVFYVLGDDRQVTDVSLKVRVTGVSPAGVENEELVRTAFVGNGGNVDAGGGELLAEDGAMREP